LLYYRIITSVSSEADLVDYLGYWASKKMVWTSVDGLRKAATSLRQFYTFLVQAGEITEEQFKQLKEEGWKRDGRK
jgi:site-specific recombinase XerD